MIMEKLLLAISFVGIGLVIYFIFSSILPNSPLNPASNPPLDIEKYTTDFKCGTNFHPGKQPPLIPHNVSPDDLKQNYTVTVIGAGVSGLEAAKKLKSMNVTYVVLEAQNRIGGRLWTCNYDNQTTALDLPANNMTCGFDNKTAALDLGGSWTHGLNKGSEGFENPIYKIDKINNIGFVQTSQTVTLYNSSGYQLDDQSYDLYQKYDTFATKYDTTLTEDERKNLSIQNVVDKFYTYMGTMKHSDIENYNYVMQWYVDMDQAANSKDTSFENSLGTQYFNEDDNNEVIYPDGYNQIVNCLGDGLNIKHATVTKVDYSKGTVIVSTDKGNFSSKYVISTLPLGVLKKHSVDFNPPLENDAAKKEALQHLAMGTMDKVYLIFDDTGNPPFWDTGSTWINRISDEQNNTNWRFFLNMYKYDHKPVLLAFNTGKSAIELEHETDDVIKSQVTDTLQKMYKDPNIHVTKIIRTKWSMNPFSGGSYSYIPVGGSLDDFDKLAAPVLVNNQPKLFFAGEATSKYYYGTVHAAYISGYRAAEEVVQTENKPMDQPLEQLSNGIKPQDVICKKGDVLKGAILNENYNSTTPFCSPP